MKAGPPRRGGPAAAPAPAKRPREEISISDVEDSDSGSEAAGPAAAKKGCVVVWRVRCDVSVCATLTCVLRRGVDAVPVQQAILTV